MRDPWAVFTSSGKLPGLLDLTTIEPRMTGHWRGSICDGLRWSCGRFQDDTLTPNQSVGLYGFERTDESKLSDCLVDHPVSVSCIRFDRLSKWHVCSVRFESRVDQNGSETRIETKMEVQGSLFERSFIVAKSSYSLFFTCWRKRIPQGKSSELIICQSKKSEVLISHPSPVNSGRRQFAVSQPVIYWDLRFAYVIPSFCILASGHSTV